MSKKPTIRQNVEALMRDYPKTRDDDQMLIYGYWKKYDGIHAVNGYANVRDILTKATSAESITRARRLIQGEGLYLPTNGVVAKRRSKEVAMRESVREGEVV